MKFYQLRVSERGAAMIESALALPLFFFLLIVGFDLLRMSYRAVSLQYLAERTSRYAVVRAVTGADIQNEFDALASSFGLDVSTASISYCPVTTSPCSGMQPGKPGELMVFRVTLPNPIILLFATFTLEATVVSKNEYFTA